METVKKKDFVELRFTGYSNENVFDSNIEEDLKKIDPKGKAKELIVIVGEKMLVPGFDNALEGKEIGKEYEIKFSAKEGFGERNRNLVKTIPLKVFTEKQINPYPGMVLAMDNNLARVITVSGARVMTDFNNPLAGKDLTYKFTITRKVTDEKEKVKVVLEAMLRFVPEFEISEKEIIVKGPEFMKQFVDAANPRFKEFIGKDMTFKLEEKKEEDNVEKKEDSEKK